MAKNWLDQYIAGDPGYYYFQIEIIWGREISGGMFHYKKDARNLLRTKLINFLNNPEEFIYPPKPEPKPRKAKKNDNSTMQSSQEEDNS